MDFVTGLPLSDTYDAILVVVDRWTKMRHLILCNTTTGLEELAKLYLHHVWKLHGLPNTIVSDRGTQFMSNFWKHLCLKLKIKAQLFRALHPETDGQTESFNSVNEQYLRSVVSYNRTTGPNGYQWQNPP